jgi:tripartite-type tricarboxylate transporter receptor subunit TctC
MIRHSLAACGMALTCAILAAGPAAAQNFPAKSVTMVIPFPAGGAVDIVCRTVAQRLSEIWKQPVPALNRPGAGGNIGVESVVRAPADGYTVLCASTALSINPALTQKLPYDVMRDLVPISQLVVTPNVLVVHPSVPAKTVRELTAIAKSQPDRLTGGSAGSGTSAHLSLELYKSLASVKIVHVAYKGSAPSLIGVVGGETDIAFLPTSVVNPHVATGRLRALAVTTARRSKTLPDVPTMDEAGVKAYEAAAWSALLAPAGTPAAVVNTLYAGITESFKSSTVQATFEKIGGEPIGSNPVEFARYLEAEITKWRKVVSAAGIKPE